MEKKRQIYHKPVLLTESVEALNINPNGVYVDVTFGSGGHSREILSRLNEGKLFAFDQDSDALANAIDDERFTLFNSNFSYLSNFLKFSQCDAIDGLLADLGVSSHQFDVAERGFSIRLDGPIDLRMDGRKSSTGADILNAYEAEEIADILYNYGDFRESRRMAKHIVNIRQERAFENISDITEAFANFAPRGKENSYFARILQALRIELNDEMGVLKSMLEQALEMLKPGGRLSVISYHSLEDRLVKNFFRSGNFKGEIEKDMYGNIITPFKVISKKPIVPRAGEIEQNNRARSAKLRIAEKI